MVGKISAYVDEKDEHAATLTVKEVSTFAFRMTTGGKHAYQATRNDENSDFFEVGKNK